MTELMTRPQTREQWLENAVEQLRPLFAAQDIHLPPVRVSVGWPSRGGTGKAKRVIGQCWKSIVAGDGIPQLFISPVLGGAPGVDSRAEQVTMLGVLVHELIHAVDDCESGHKGPFRDMAVRMGLEGKMTATVPGEKLIGELAEILKEIGDYPHAALNPREMEKQRTPQTTRMLKVVCPEDGYLVRTTAKWLEVGTPTCPCGQTMEPEL